MERRTSARLRPASPPPPRDQGRDTAAAAARRARRRLQAERAREVEESPAVVAHKVALLAAAVRGARHLVVYTGAGVSTAARIPDYRGPRGLWTRLRAGRDPPRVDAAAARPTLTHMALAALWRRGRLRFVASQNCDGLHLRAGLPRRALAELHGDMFVETCGACAAAVLRAFDTTERTARHRHRTRRLCPRCGDELRDSIVHFGERGRARWPLNWRGALRHAAAADVLLCLGSSLKVLRRYPRLWGRPRRRPRLFIVNLQWTPKDSAAELKISARCDDVMRLLCRELGVRVPQYRARADPLFAHHTPLSARELHTTRRRELRAPSSSADSDDERPLREVADRLRPPVAFTVRLAAGPAAILLRPRHAPASDDDDDRPLAESRLRHRNGDARPPGGGEDVPSAKIRMRADIENEIIAEMKNNIKREIKDELADADRVKCEAKSELTNGVKSEAGPAAAQADDDEVSLRCMSLARAIIAAALSAARPRLYPGLHTCLAPARGGGECGWCAARLGAERCQFYRRLAGGGAREVGGRRVHCACCGEGQAAGGAAAGGGGGADGWYGKGYRKFVRRKR